MRYLALLYIDEATQPPPGSPEWEDLHRGYMRFNELAGSAIAGGDALQPAATAATVRTGDGGPLVTAGPFAETAEVIAGFYVLDADTLDDAIELARHIPAASHGGVELRPMVQWTSSPDDPRPGAPGPGDGRDRYLAVILAKHTEGEEPGTPAGDERAAAHARFAESAGGALAAGGALQPATTATTVRVHDGEVLVTDGPFAETAEAVSGIYAFHAMTRDEALDLAGRIPTGLDGAVELRPVMELG